MVYFHPLNRKKIEATRIATLFAMLTSNWILVLISYKPELLCNPANKLNEVMNVIISMDGGIPPKNPWCSVQYFWRVYMYLNSPKIYCIYPLSHKPPTVVSASVAVTVMTLWNRPRFWLTMVLYGSLMKTGGFWFRIILTINRACTLDRDGKPRSVANREIWKGKR